MKAGLFFLQPVSIFAVLFSIFVSCNFSPDRKFLPDLIKGQTSVLVFLSPSCPMCQNYTRTLNQLDSAYRGKGISFIAIFGPKRSDDTTELYDFNEIYHLTLSVVRDAQNLVAHEMKATVTPEAFLVSSRGEILYQGSIDNWLIEPGQKRTLITEHYLEDALKAYISGQSVKVKFTPAKGCLIE